MKILFFLTSIVLFHSCLDEIDLSVPQGLEEGIVIIGELRKSDPSFIKINISSIFNFDLETLTPTSAKSVFLIDEKGEQLEIPIVGNGINTYTFKGNEVLKVEFGQRYKIRVTDKKERIFESTFEELMPLPEKGNLEYERANFSVLNERGEVEELPAVQFLLNSSVKIENSNQNARLFWIPQRTFQLTDSVAIPDFISKTCYVTANIKITELYLLNGGDLTTEQIEAYPLSKVLLNHEFSEGYYYSIYQKSLTKGAFEYWKQTKQVIDRTGNQFESPVGRIITNFQDIDNPNSGAVFGYFTAYAEDTLRLCITPEELDFPLKLCPPPVSNCSVPSPCCDCLIERGSQLEIPIFWEK